MPEAARQTDPVTHGGTIVSGSANVITEGLATARKLDLVKCEVHGTAAVAQTSQTVIVNGRGFARKDDGCACEGSAGPGQQDVVAFILSVHGSDKTIDEILEETNGHGPHLQAVLKDTDQDGTLDSVVVDGAVVSINLTGEHGSFRMDVGKVHAEATYIRGENAIDGPVPLNQYIAANASASAFETEATVNLGDNAAVTADGKIYHAEAKTEALIGSAGDIQGVILEAGASASAVSGSAKTEVNGTAGEFIERLGPTPLGASLVVGSRLLSAYSPEVREMLETPIKLEIGKGISGGSVGVEGRFAAYYNRRTEQSHFDLGGELAALVGLEFDLSLTVGEDASQADTGAAEPNLIVSGACTVVVGD